MTRDSHKIVDEYFAIYSEYIKEYGEKTCVLMQIGSFYEIQMVKNEQEKLGNLEEVSEILNIQITKKNKSNPIADRSNPYMGGFPKISLPKYVGPLLEAGYTIVTVDQDENNPKKRSVSHIYSPGIQPLNLLEEKSSSDGNNLTSVLVEVEKGYIRYSICNINMSTNSFEVYENIIANDSRIYENVLDDINRMMLRFDSKEIIFNVNKSDVAEFAKDYVIEYLSMYHKSFHWGVYGNEKCLEKISYQNDFLKKVYKHVSFGLLSPLEYFELERAQLASLNCIIILNFITKHDLSYVQNIACPKLIKECDYLLLQMNTMQQLSILPTNTNNHKFNSLFCVVNKTKTAIGRRGLKSLLSKPLKSSVVIQYKYDLCDLIYETSSTFEDMLSGVCDFVKLHRRMSLSAMHPYEFCNLNSAYNRILQINDFIISIKTQACDASLKDTTVQTLQNYMEEYTSTFDLDELRKYNSNESSISIENFFKKGKVKEIDEIDAKIKIIESQVEDIRQSLETLINKDKHNDWVKQSYTDQDGYFFTCTKIRTDMLLRELGEKSKEYNVKYTANMSKISSVKLKEFSLALVNLRALFVKRIFSKFNEYLQLYSNKYQSIFKILQTFIEDIDIAQSNIKCKKLYGYCKPKVVKNDDSFLKVKGIRHPIIERVNENTAYIPNDIILDSSKKGMILYAMNSCGKSSLLKSIGLCTIMAQCGLYVPCTEFEFSPFESIITQVDMTDNLWKAQSSFVTEMVGLKQIIKLANRNCLVLSDELTKGTENTSATALFAASVLDILKKETKFVFTTHLQDVSKLEEINSQSDLQICHLSVDINGEIITFQRKISPGSCNERYGLEVARAVGLDTSIINKAFEIRDKVDKNKTEILRTKQSRYNSKKILDSCEICNYFPAMDTDLPLDTHHIKFQCTANSENFTEHYHKNSVFNLVCLCKSCHIKVHEGKININGYVATTSGIKLDYSS